ncbi:gamma-glutamylcyclotransferase [Microbacterium horticulturae]|uniref:Gamma-glutamylcyclotransferase n=1 Tax=Microbacterium horticulturae TaxID=3028316 RepID=A0ABY8C0K9_9MICO|nr:gamma-glutamylcyclotransferase family protein [Microbacterium sp. KACC 23027]WEG09953.1 gamma-glutamylcyclotransferase [Microbacterium sp. KACC 23027]
MSSKDQLLFTYGTLRYADVQLDTFGRLVDGDDDELVGFVLGDAPIDDPRVVELSGSALHTIAIATGDDTDRIPGTVLRISEDELASADDYEVAIYRRVQVPLASGRTAWTYVSA